MKGFPLVVRIAIVALAGGVAQLEGQIACQAPGLGTTPILTGWENPAQKIYAIKKMPDGSWTRGEFNMLNPFNMLTTTPNIQDAVEACAPPGTAHNALAPAIRAAATPADAMSEVLETSPTAVLINTIRNSILMFVAFPILRDVAIYSVDSSYFPAKIQQFVAGLTETSFALADLNGDGHPEVIVANEEKSAIDDGGSIAILMNKGDDTFAGPVQYTAGNRPVNAAIGDVNGDGIPDIVTADNFGSTISVLIGNGNGTFKASVHYPTGQPPYGILLADFNGDGKLDAAIGNGSGALAVLLNNGSGAFGSAVTTATGGNYGPADLKAFDFDGDGKLDIAMTSAYNNEVRIFRGKGGGSFTAAAAYAVDLSPAHLVVTDIDGDGIEDLVVGSGIADYIGPDWGNTNMTFLLSNGDGTFRGTGLHNVADYPDSVAIGDFNNDGKADLVTASQFSNPSVAVLSGDGSGSFAAAANVVALGSTPAVAAADFDGDGSLDIAAGTSTSTVVVARGNGHGGFTTATPSNVPAAPSWLTVGDFDGDGKPDVLASQGSLTGLVTNGALSLLIGKGDGSFKTPTTLLTGVNARMAAAGDFNLDGKLDAAAVVGGNEATQSPGSLRIFLGGNGTLTAQTAISVGTTPSDPAFVAAGDVNGDGRLDLVVASEDFNFGFFVQVFLGKGDGTFQPLTPVRTDFGPTSIVIHDFSGDGRPDLVVTHCCGATDMTYLTGNGDGTFQTETHFTAGQSPFATALGELNGDGVQDLVVTNFASSGNGTASVTLGTGLRTQSSASFAFMPLAPESIVASFGHGMSNGTVVGVTANSLDGTTVDVKDSAGVTRQATLTYISPHQVNYIIPTGTASGLATVTVHSSAGTDLTTQYYVAPASPGVYLVNDGGLAAAYVVRVHQNGTSVVEPVFQVVNNQVVAKPLDLGVAAGDQVFLEIFGTGLRGVAQANLNVTIEGVNALVSYVGPQGSPGLDQVNVQIPTSLAGKGKVTVKITANGSQVANLANFVVQ